MVYRQMDLHLPIAVGSETYIAHVRISFFFLRYGKIITGRKVL